MSLSYPTDTIRMTFASSVESLVATRSYGTIASSIFGLVYADCSSAQTVVNEG